MQIDVVIPTYNRLWALPTVAAAYLGQDEVRRVIVVDDCSTDGTATWLADEARRSPRILPVRHDRNRGASAARNTGAAAADAPFVFFADDDMLLDPPDGLSFMIREMIAHDAHLAAPVHILPESGERLLPPVGAPGAPAPEIFTRRTLELRPRRSLARCTMPPSFSTPLACGVMLVRREVLGHVRYDEDLGATGYRDETDFQLTALGRGFRLLGCSRPVLIDLAHPGDRGGCHAASAPVRYELQACRNNWRVLVRHRDVIRRRLGIAAPIALLQARFVIEHSINRLARQYVSRALRRCGLRR